MTSDMTSPVPTRPIYQLDESVRLHPAKILAIVPISHLPDGERDLFKGITPTSPDAPTHYAIQTDETIFYAQGGGQPYDTGYMTFDEARFNVDAVRHGANGRILHVGTFAKSSASHFAAGNTVEQHIDSERRDTNSRCHTAGHIIGLAVRRLTEKERALEGITELKASHYPDACFVEFKGLIDGKFKEQIQSQATEYVKKSLPIKLYWHKPEELSERGVITAEGMPIVAGHDGKVRVVNIEGAGAYPCGGTHVQETSLVGVLTIKGIKRQKGISKVSYTIS